MIGSDVVNTYLLLAREEGFYALSMVAPMMMIILDQVEHNCITLYAAGTTCGLRVNFCDHDHAHQELCSYCMCFLL